MAFMQTGSRKYGQQHSEGKRSVNQESLAYPGRVPGAGGAHRLNVATGWQQWHIVYVWPLAKSGSEAEGTSANQHGPSHAAFGSSRAARPHTATPYYYNFKF